MKNICVLVTGGLGFIGSEVVKKLLKLNLKVINLDKVTYAANINRKKEFNLYKNSFFHKVDILDQEKLNFVFNKYKPNLVLNLAAESHVDNSINNPENFINTNILGTYNLLLEVQKLHQNKHKIKFVQISTDEVYGDTVKKTNGSKEDDPYLPSSPYSASKASSDHLVRAWSRTYGIRYNITCSANNFGPYQHDEKFIPVIIKNAIKKKKIPIYGNGLQKRNWIYVEDNADAILEVALKGKENSTYNIGTKNDYTNKFMANEICRILHENYSLSKNIFKLIKNIDDRPGHDLKYKINYNKIIKEVNWKPKFSFRKSIIRTIDWYYKRFNEY